MDPLTLTVLGAFLGGLGVAGALALARRSPRVMRLFKRYFLGLEFLVVGHGQAGKTSFYNYLWYNRFADEYPARKTLIVSDRMAFDVDKGGDLKMSIASAFDIPGELPVDGQVRMTRERLPVVLIVFTSIDNVEALNWLRAFLLELRTAMATDRGLAKRLRALTVVVNKVDKKAQAEVTQVIAQHKETVYETLTPVLGKNVRLVDVVSCTLRRDSGGERAANEVILSVVESVQLTRKLVPR